VDRVEQFLKDPATAPGRAARLEQARRFSWAEQARTILGAYERLLHPA
jgi:hypothetical protein